MEQVATVIQNMTNLQKVAIILVALGTDRAAQILGKLDEEHVERIAREIAKLDRIDEELKLKVLEEFRQRCEGTIQADINGLKMAQDLIRKIFDPQKAEQMLDMLRPAGQEDPLAALQKASVSDIVALIADEHPQVIALVLCNLAPEKAASVISQLPEKLQGEVSLRIANSDSVMPTVTSRLARALERKASGRRPEEQGTAQAGRSALIEIMKNVDRQTERSVLGNLVEHEPDLATYLRDQLFVFEDILKISDKHVQILLREIDQDDLRTSLRGSGDEIKAVVFRNMSENARDALKEDLDMGQPVRLKDVENAQRNITMVLRRLTQEKRITIGAKEEEYV